MAATEKVITLFGLRGVLEGTYAGSTFPLTTPTAILMMEPAEAEISYIHDGERGLQPGAGGVMVRSKKSGRSISFTYKVEARGAGSAYATATTPQDIHIGMLMSGHAGTVVETPSSESWTYDPESTGFDSGAFEAFGREEQLDIEGCYASMSFEAEAGGHGVFSFETQGLLDSLPSDAAVPALTYQGTGIEPPKVEDISLDINGVSTLVCRSISFTQGRVLSPRADANTAAGHAGFTAGRVDPRMEIVVEAVALSTINPYTLAENMTEMSALSFTIGATQYNKYGFSADQAQLINVTPDSDGDTALWTLEFVLAASTPVANDWYSWVWD